MNVSPQLSKHALAACAVCHRMLTVRTAKHNCCGPTTIGPLLRLLTNGKGIRGHRHVPQDRCGQVADTLAANRLPACRLRLQAGGSKQVTTSAASNLQLAVATSPVMCCICCEGFTHNGVFFGALREASRRLCQVPQEVASGVRSGRASNLCCPGSSATSCERLPSTLPVWSQAVALSSGHTRMFSTQPLSVLRSLVSFASGKNGWISVS